MTTGRKTKYTDERVETIIQILEKTGSDSLAIEAAGVNRSTFYKWLTEKEDFSNKVAQAQSIFFNKGKDATFDRMKAAEDWLDRLFKGEVTKTTTKIITLPDGGQRTEVTTEEIIPQHYHLQRVLGPLHVNPTEETDFAINISLAEPPPTSGEGDE